MLRPAIPHLGGEKVPVLDQNPTADTLSQMDGNTGSLHAKSNSKSTSTNSVTESPATYKKNKKNADAPISTIQTTS